MQQFLQKYGRALDISGAFSFILFGIFAAYHGLHVLALAFFFGALAWFASWRAWRAPDAVEVSFNRMWCAICVCLSFATFMIALIFEVFANV